MMLNIEMWLFMLKVKGKIMYFMLGLIVGGLIGYSVRPAMYFYDNYKWFSLVGERSFFEIVKVSFTNIWWK